MLNRLLILILAAIFLIIGVNLFFHKTDNCSDQLFYFSSESDEPTLEIIVNKANKCLYEQRAIFTIPQINKMLLERVFKIKVSQFISQLFENVYSLFLKLFFNNDNFPYGGIILYDYNFKGNLEDDKSKIDEFRKIKSRELFFYNKLTKSKFLVVIEPYILADCVPFNVPHAYCRAMSIDQESLDWFDEDSLEKLTLEVNNKNSINQGSESAANSYMQYIEFYKDMGIDSALGPVVDMPKSSDISVVKYISEYAKKLSLFMYKEDFIPTLKHFAYNQKLADSHYSYALNEISLEELKKILTPYADVDKLNIPYMIMTTHQGISALDKENPASQSKAVYSFIQKNFPNSLVIADSISMDGMSGSNYYEKLIRGEADTFIIHLGINFPSLNLYNSKKALEEMSINKNAILKVLKNKEMYNKITIKKISGGDQQDGKV